MDDTWPLEDQLFSRVKELKSIRERLDTIDKRRKDDPLAMVRLLTELILDVEDRLMEAEREYSEF